MDPWPSTLSDEESLVAMWEVAPHINDAAEARIAEVNDKVHKRETRDYHDGFSSVTRNAIREVKN